MRATMRHGGTRADRTLAHRPCPPVAPHAPPPPGAEGDTHEHEVAPAPNPRVLLELRRADALIYGMGSLYTSVVPSLILRGVGECVAATHVPKVRAAWAPECGA